MEKAKELVKKLILIIYAIFIILFLGSIIRVSSHKYILMYAFIIGVSALIYFLKKKEKLKFSSKNINKIFLISSIILIVIGIILRIGLLFLEYLPPTSDYLTFYTNAESYASQSIIKLDQYISIFPYLLSYILTLASAFKLIGISYNSVIILNIIIDVLSAVILYFTFKDKDDLVKGLFVSAIWLINPINIIWCAFPAPIAITNLFIVFLILLMNKKEKFKERRKLFLVISILIGIVLGIANQFRPIFIVAIIAIILWELYKIIFTKDVNKSFALLGLILIVGTYLCTNKLGFIYRQNIMNKEIASSSGWTLYLGANVDSGGMWNEEDSKKFGLRLEETPFSPQKLQKDFEKDAIDRYMQNGIKANIKLMIHKFKVLTSDIASYSVNSLFGIQTTITNEKVQLLINCLINCLFFVMILINFFTTISKRNDDKIYFYMLLSLGLLVSHLFVEVSPRYSLHALVPMIIITSLWFYKIIKNTKLLGSGGKNERNS